MANQEMEHLHDEMKKIRTASALEHGATNKDSVNLQGTLSSPDVAVKMKLRPLLDEMVKTFMDGDPQLIHKSPMTDTLGFTLVLPAEQLWLSKAFYVTVDVAKTEDPKVTVEIVDGQWEQVEGYLGNYADWTDKRVVYSARFDDGSIRQALETAFLSWYRHIYPVQ